MELYASVTKYIANMSVSVRLEFCTHYLDTEDRVMLHCAQIIKSRKDILDYLDSDCNPDFIYNEYYRLAKRNLLTKNMITRMLYKFREDELYDFICGAPSDFIIYSVWYQFGLKQPPINDLVCLVTEIYIQSLRRKFDANVYEESIDGLLRLLSQPEYDIYHKAPGEIHNQIQTLRATQHEILGIKGLEEATYKPDNAFVLLYGKIYQWLEHRIKFIRNVYEEYL